MRVINSLVSWLLRAATDKRIDLQEGEEAVLRGHASFDTRWFDETGSFVLTTRRLAYRSYEGRIPIVGGKPRTINVPLASISEVSVAKKRTGLLNPVARPVLRVTTKDGRTYEFRPVDPESWARRIETSMSDLNSAST